VAVKLCGFLLQLGGVPWSFPSKEPKGEKVVPDIIAPKAYALVVFGLARIFDIFCHF
jgi:hypothetical protein